MGRAQRSSTRAGLNAAGVAASGVYDLGFAVYDAATNGNAVSRTLTNSATTVTNGLFCVTLDFGPGVFGGSQRWLELEVRTNGASEFSVLQAAPAPSAPRLMRSRPRPPAICWALCPQPQLSGTVADGLLSRRMLPCWMPVRLSSV